MEFRFSTFVLDVDQGRLHGPDGDIPLRRQTLRTLQLLLERAPSVVSRDELLDAVWGHQAITANAVSQTILELRKALGDSPSEGRLIETRHRIGYRIVPPVQRDRGAPHEAAAAADNSVVHAAPPRPRRPWSIIVTAGVTLLLAGAVWWFIQDRSTADPVATVLQVNEQLPGPTRQDYFSGLLALRDGRLAESVVRLQRANAASPAAITVRAAYAEALVTAGRFREARTVLEQAAESTSSLSRSDRLRWEALLAEANHDSRTAMSQRQAVFTYQPEDVEAGYALFDLQLGFADADAASTTLKALQRREPDASPRLELARARLAALRGDVEQREALASSAEQKSEPNTVLSVLAELEVCEARLARSALVDASRCAIDAGKRATSLGHARIAARAAAIVGVAAREGGRYDEARTLLQSTATEAQQRGDRIAWRDTELELAMVERSQGEFAAALERLERLDDALAFSDDRPGRARLLGIRGMALAQQGAQDEARQALGAAIEQAVALDLRQLEAGARNNRALLDARSGRNAESEQGFDAALSLFRTLGDRRGEAMAMSNLAIHASRGGRAAESRDYNLAALKAFRAINARAEIARTQFNLGVAEHRRGSLQDAAARIEEALMVFHEQGSTHFEAQAAAVLAYVQLERGLPAKAIAAIDGIALAEVEDPLRRSAVMMARARVAMYTGQFETARSVFSEALDLRRQAGTPAWALETELDLAQLDLTEGRVASATAAAAKLAPGLREVGELAEAAAADLLWVSCRLAAGDPLAARERLGQVAQVLGETGDLSVDLEHELLSLVSNGSSADTLHALAARARESGHELLALRAELAADDTDTSATDVVARIESAGLVARALRIGASPR